MDLYGQSVLREISLGRLGLTSTTMHGLIVPSMITYEYEQSILISKDRYDKTSWTLTVDSVFNVIAI